MNQPVYAINNPPYRIVYKANGLWKLQELGNTKSSSVYDPWHDMSPLMTYDRAMAVLARYHREKA